MSEYRDLSTDEVRARHAASAQRIAGLEATVADLERQLAAAAADLSRARLRHDHLTALLAWRERAGCDDGDLIADLDALLDAIDARWRVLTLEQLPTPDLEASTCALTLRAPDGSRRRIAFDGLATYGDGALFRTPLEPTTLRLNQAVELAWSEQGHRFLSVICRATRSRPRLMIEISGAVRRMSTHVQPGA